MRTGARWHLIEQTPGQFSFDSLRKTLDPAEETGTEVLLDLMHFGWPDDLKLLANAFPARFRQFVEAISRFIRDHKYTCCTAIAPVNEVSFLSWAGGEAACINPYQKTTSHQIKRNLIRAGAAACEVIRQELPAIRLISPEPAIHIVGNPRIAHDDVEAERYRLSQFQAWDMLSGRMNPELRGKPEYLDIIGVNFYDRNEWVHNSKTFLPRTDPRFRPLHEILKEIWLRYKRPLFIAETGAEEEERASWFNYISDEVITAHAIGVPVEGICWYPIVNHPGWADNRHCHNGLFDYANDAGERELCQPLADAILTQQPRLTQSYQRTHEVHSNRSDLSFASSMELCLSAPATSHEPVCT